MKKSQKETLAADAAAPAAAPQPPRKGRDPNKTTSSGKPRKRPLRSKAAIEKAAKLAEDQAEALRMRRNGTPYKEIAAMFDVSVTTAHRWVTDAIKAIPKEAAEEMRHHMLSRYDRLTEMYMEALEDMEGTMPPDNVVNMLLQLDQRRAKLLGLDFSDRMIAESYKKQADSYVQQGDKYGEMLKADVPILRPDAPLPPQPVL